MSSDSYRLKRPFLPQSGVYLYMFLVSGNIGGRYFFNKPIDGTMEIGQIVLASVIFFNLAYAQMKGAHIRVTAVLELMPKPWRWKIETAILALGFLLMAMLAWRAYPFAMYSFHLREVHMSVDVPIWPTKFIFLIGWSMFGMQFLLEFLGRILPDVNPDKDEQSA
jgi:TRAP-type C4-dicarboxylate transport system permease small subunit